MPETRDALFVLAAGAGVILAMYQWVTMIADTMPCLSAPMVLRVAITDLSTRGSPTSRGGRASVRQRRSLSTRRRTRVPRKSTRPAPATSRPALFVIESISSHNRQQAKTIGGHGRNDRPGPPRGKILGDFVTIAWIVTASFESLCASGANTRRQIRNIAIIKTGFGDLPVRISAVLSLIPLNQAPAFKRVQSPREISLR